MLTASFFSYKGGSGRTSLLYNTLPYLAEKLNASPEHPIVVVDCDTESAGLTFLLNCYQEKQSITLQSICNDGLEYAEVDSPSIIQHPFFKMLPQVGKSFGFNADGKAGTVLFVPAAKGSIKFIDGASDNKLNALKKMCMKNNVAALIFDTPAGDQRAADWSVDASKNIVTVLRITNQFRVGTRRYFKDHLGKWENKRFILCPNAVPQQDIVIDGNTINLQELKHEKIMDFFSEAFEDSPNILDFGMLQGLGFGVNEVQRFKYNESLLYVVNEDNLSEDEKLAVSRYKLLADILGDKQ